MKSKLDHIHSFLTTLKVVANRALPQSLPKVSAASLVPTSRVPVPFSPASVPVTVARPSPAFVTASLVPTPAVPTSALVPAPEVIIPVRLAVD